MKIPSVPKTATFSAALLVLTSFLLLTRSAAGSSINLTTNWGFEEGFGPDGVGLEWNSFVLSGDVTFANTIEYFWPGAEHTEGQTSQLIISDDAFAAGLYQQISGVTPGVPYGAKAAMLTIFESSAPPPNHGKMQKIIGIDPYGGTDPDSPHIIWSPIDDHDEGPWVDMRVAAVAEATTITLFVRVNCLEPVWHPATLDNQVHIDAVMLAQAPSVSASSPPVSSSPTFIVTWDNAEAAPGGYVVKYDVEYKDDVNNTWILWQDKTGATSDVFTGVSGRKYTFRARAYQRYTAWHNIRLFGAWSDGDTSTTVTIIGGVEGYVRDNRDIPLLGATVTILGTEASAATSSGGYYYVAPPLPGTYDLWASNEGYHSPPEIRDIDIYEPVVELDFILRPQDDVVSNGDFEEGLSNWETVVGSAVPPTIVDDVVRSGAYSLVLGLDSPTSGDCGITQTVYLTPTMYMPTLSFWYQTVSTNGGNDDLFEVGIYEDDPWTYHLLSMVEPSEGWSHAWFDLSPYTGSTWIYFNYHQEGSQDMIVYLDEVSLGRASGGPLKNYLPIVLVTSSD